MNDSGKPSKGAWIVAGIVGLFVLGLLGAGGQAGAGKKPASAPSKTDCFAASLAAKSASEQKSYSDAQVSQLNDNAEATCDAYQESPRGKWND
jgi:hypothetical protein